MLICLMKKIEVKLLKSSFKEIFQHLILNSFFTQKYTFNIFSPYKITLTFI